MFIRFASLIVLGQQNVLIVGVVALYFPLNSGHGYL